MLCLHAAYRMAGIDAKSVTVLLTVETLFDDSILDKLNQFLLTGFLPGAIKKKELDSIADDMRSSLQDGTAALLTDRQIFATFEQRAWSNMHIVLCCRPEDPGFRDMLMRFPVLMSSCQIMWMEPWAGRRLFFLLLQMCSCFTEVVTVDMLFWQVRR